MSAKLYSFPRNTQPGGLFDYADPNRYPKSGRAKRPSKIWEPEIVDDWPEHIPVSEQELNLFEVHCADLLDEIFGPKT